MINKLLNNKFGFTLIETVVAASLVGVVALIGAGVLKSNNQAVSKSIVANETSTLKSLIASTLSNARACNATFPNGTSTNRLNFPILNSDDAVVIAQGNFYGPAREIRIMQISSALVNPNGNILRITVNYDIQNNVSMEGRRDKFFTVDIFVNKSAPTVISGCLADLATSVREAIRASCFGVGAVYDPGVAPYGTCTHNIPVVRDAGATIVDPVCPPGQFLKQVQLEAAPNRVVLQCATLNVAPCPPWSYLQGFDSSGTPTCLSFASLGFTPGRALTRNGTNYLSVNLNCGPNQALARLDGSGNPQCVDKVVNIICPVGQYVTNVASSAAPPVAGCAPFVVATPAPCPGGEYLRRVNPDGSIPPGGCEALRINASCPVGFVIGGADASGNASCVQP